MRLSTKNDASAFRSRLLIRQLMADRRAVIAANRRRPKRAPRMLDPLAAERQYQRSIEAIVGTMKGEVKRTLIPELGRLVASDAALRGDSLRLDRLEDIKRLIQLMKAGLFGVYTAQQIDAMVAETTREIEAHNRRQINKVFRAIVGIDVFTSSASLAPLMGDFVSQNVALIRSLVEDTFGRIETIVTDGTRIGLRHETIARQLIGVVEGGRKNPFDNARRRAALIAQDQVGKFNGQLNMTRQAEAGVEEYTWRTSLDERVRHSHRALEGGVFTWDLTVRPALDDGVATIPGFPIRCRCYGEPRLPGIYEP